jgi:hypothetical protein
MRLFLTLAVIFSGCGFSVDYGTLMDCVAVCEDNGGMADVELVCTDVAAEAFCNCANGVQIDLRDL